MDHMLFTAEQNGIDMTANIPVKTIADQTIVPWPFGI
jgi:hypothetical protein